jgi:hypothetical protein
MVSEEPGKPWALGVLRTLTRLGSRKIIRFITFLRTKAGHCEDRGRRVSMCDTARLALAGLYDPWTRFIKH